jgi:hypothetical protein
MEHQQQVVAQIETLVGIPSAAGERCTDELE